MYVTVDVRRKNAEHFTEESHNKSEKRDNPRRVKMGDWKIGDLTYKSPCVTTAQIEEWAVCMFVVKQEPEQRPRDSYNAASDTFTG